MTKEELFSKILPTVLSPENRAEAYAPANIALVKYWGKRDNVLNLPYTGSLSISLSQFGTRTIIYTAERDSVILNGNPVALESSFAQRIFTFINLFRRGDLQPLKIETYNTIPLSAGMASSASGFAALTLALNNFWRLSLPDAVLSILARIGSGSAARSLWHGFVEWQVGERHDGMDSYAQPIQSDWRDLRIALLEIDLSCKKVSSRSGMQHTVLTSPLYTSWTKTVADDLIAMKQAIIMRDFSMLGEVAEGNALAMHATMLSARPALIYFQTETYRLIERVRQLREDGLEIYITADAGPNLKLLYDVKNESTVREVFPYAQIINPFAQLF